MAGFLSFRSQQQPVDITDSLPGFLAAPFLGNNNKFLPVVRFHISGACLWTGDLIFSTAAITNIYLWSDILSRTKFSVQNIVFLPRTKFSEFWAKFPNLGKVSSFFSTLKIMLDQVFKRFNFKHACI